ncbi:MAG: SAM-dependent methyltransferase [Proteobacteria bacterium]|nr:SAM-dependent methyltransferase [Pseudomonadota bacterium]
MTAPFPQENQDLKQIILNRIHREGKIPFSEFMEHCLYHPGHGYYMTEGEKIGKKGDYYTSPSVHPVFGRLLARQLGEMGDLLQDGTFWIVEAGAGRGMLARDILDFVAQEFPVFFARLKYGVVETGPRFVKEQEVRLAPYVGKVEWLNLQEVREASLQGCFLANEFFDAFPVHRVVLQNGALEEIYVTEEDGRFCEVLGELTSEEIPRYLDDLDIRLGEGEQAEVNLKALDWYDQVGRVLNRGFLMTIDYGYLAQDLNASQRRSGTLLCYYRHTCSDNPYGHIGLQDLTTHVNFSGLIRKGETLGFSLTGFVRQYRFLLSLGFLDEIQRLRGRAQSGEAALRESLKMKHLVLPDGGMGETFKVLIQHRGVDDVQLRGLCPL